MADTSLPADGDFTGERHRVRLSGRRQAHVLSVHRAQVGETLRVGLPDRYITHGAPPLLHEEVGFTPAAVTKRVTDRLASRTAADA